MGRKAKESFDGYFDLSLLSLSSVSIAALAAKRSAFYNIYLSIVDSGCTFSHNVPTDAIVATLQYLAPVVSRGAYLMIIIIIVQ